MMDGILLVNKPAGMTSHDVVNRIRKILHTKKVGHCGTLDPDATGVLVLCVGKATKALQFLMSESKEYQATLVLGQATDTFDSSGKIVEEKEFHGVENVEEVLQSFIGVQQQIPPIYSAIKVDGKKLYEYARNQEKVDIQPRSITINQMTLIEHHNQLITFRVQCSKGTYIRSLCVDIGKKLGYPAHMTHLIRLASGNFRLENCFDLDKIEQGEFQLLSLEEAFKHFEHYVIEDESIVYHGKKIKSDIDHQVVVCHSSGRVLAVYGPDGAGYLKSIRGLF